MSWLAALARVKESKLVRLKAAGYARDATVPLCAARIAGTTASKGSKGVLSRVASFAARVSKRDRPDS